MDNKIVGNLMNKLVGAPKQSNKGKTSSVTTEYATTEFLKTPKPLVDLAEVLVITSYPPRECGIATYSQDLIKALQNKFSQSFSVKVCALESGASKFKYPEEVKYILDTTSVLDYERVVESINHDKRIKIVLIQHEFGFYNANETDFLQFLYKLTKPVVTVFHTVLPRPDKQLKAKVNHIAAACVSMIVMTHHSEKILISEYGIPAKKINVIAHGTHLVPHLSKNTLKAKYELDGRKVLSTFGLLSSGKSIETTINALPAIVEQCPEVMFLVIGKTHPEVVKHEAEKYRHSLEQLVERLKLTNHVKFINAYVALPELLEYLQLTDIYLFTTNDPNQAVSGTFAYAMSCACPIISTPIPHALEVLNQDTGIIFDFGNSSQLAEGVLTLLNDEPLRTSISSNTLQKIVSTAWENSAVSHTMLLEEILEGKISIQYNRPAINLNHLHQMTTAWGIIQFSKINQPDIETGYTLDDNARAMVAMCMYFKHSDDESALRSIDRYLGFIDRCQLPSGKFFNYVNKHNKYSAQNKAVNLDDSNGRAVWALGYLLSLKDIMPRQTLARAEVIIDKALTNFDLVHSTRAMAFAIKGLYYCLTVSKSASKLALLTTFANRLANMYKHEKDGNWQWFESYLTYANSVLPEAMLYAFILTKNADYKDIAVQSFDFLLSQTFNENGIEVISNKKWLMKGQKNGRFGEQPIDVAYTIMTLKKFYQVLGTEIYRQRAETAFSWFLGNNRLRQIIYNPCTGGCYDGLEQNHVNLNQGAESTISYLMARLTMERI